jgi:rare lipoprotein A
MATASVKTTAMRRGFAALSGKVGRRWVILPCILLAGFNPLVTSAESKVGKASNLQSRPQKTQTGKASYYCQKFHGKKTASGQLFNRHDLVAAHSSFPFGTRLQVTNLENGRQVKVRVVDRGPSRAHRARGIIIDLSRGAAERLHMLKKGKAWVKLEVLEWGKSKKILGETNGEKNPNS